MPEQTPVESGPLVMDAMAVVREMRRPSEKVAPAPSPEPTQAETPVAPATTETQEPVASPTQVEPVAGESQPTDGAPVPTTPVETRTSEAIEPKPAESKRDWRVDEFYKVKKELDELKAKATQPAPAATTPAPQPVTPQTPAIEAEPVFDPEKYPGGYDQFVGVLAAWHGAKAARDLAAQRATEQSRQTQQQQIDEGRARWQQVINENGIADYWDVVPKMQTKFNEDFIGECVASPVGPKILHFLATNPQEAIRIDGLGKRAQFREFEALENRFKTPAAAAPPAAAAVPALNTGVSKAPPPIQTIRTGASQPPRKSEAELATLSPEEYQKAHPEIKVYRGIHSNKSRSA